MTRCVGAVAAALAALAGLAACGVTVERAPEPLPPTAPVVLPPSVVQEPAPAPPPATPSP